MNPMYLDGGTRSHFMGFLEAKPPAIVRRYERLYAKTYVPKNDATLVKRRFSELRQANRLSSREEGL